MLHKWECRLHELRRKRAADNCWLEKNNQIYWCFNSFQAFFKAFSWTLQIFLVSILAWKLKNFEILWLDGTFNRPKLACFASISSRWKSSFHLHPWHVLLTMLILTSWKFLLDSRYLSIAGFCRKQEEKF